MFLYSGFEGYTSEAADRSLLRDGRGNLRTRSLFWETSDKEMAEKYPPLYTLKEQECNGSPSAYQIYMSSVDEYDAAMKLVGSLKHWRRLAATSWFMDGVKNVDGLRQWREDMKLRDASTAKRAVISAVSDGDMASARKLLDISVKPQDTQRGPGRPPTGKKEREEGELSEGRNARIKALARARGKGS